MMIGNQTPTYSWCASYDRTEGPLASRLADAYGMPPHPWQRLLLNDWLALDDEGRLLNSMCVLPVPRQNGKALSLDTEIPTPCGWRRMADIHVGDYVYGQDGRPALVTLESEVFHKPMYRVTFDDGAMVDASEDHVWTVQTHDSIDSCRYVPKTGVKKSTKYHGDGWFELTTKKMLADYVKPRSDGRCEFRYRVPMSLPVAFPEADLPIHPYLLGAWLGDGTSKNGDMTISEQDAPEFVPLLEECGYPLTLRKHAGRAPSYTIDRRPRGWNNTGKDSFFSRLKTLGVIGNKHVPEAYMVASIEQRWELLRGLMDTDGSCSKAGQCEFVQKNKRLAEQVHELCASLGIKARIHAKAATCNGKDAGTVYRVTFFADAGHPCFKMQRKRERLKDGVAARTRYKAIKSIERIEDSPSKCIAIDNDSHLYLAGRLCTPTHNTGVCDPRETWGLVQRGEWILHTAQEFQTAKKAFDRLRAKFGDRTNDPLAKFPELNALVKRYTVSAGQMILDLTNGAHIEFRTRGSNSDMGRGGTFDLVVVDEAQSYTDAQDAALSPLNSAAPTGSPQTIFMGTVPDPTSAHKGEKFATIRASLHESPYAGACIHEWGASEVGDVNDVARWYEYNPSLGYQLLERSFWKDVRTMGPDTFAREHLGWWPEAIATTAPIIRRDWDRCRIENPERKGLVCYAVKFSPDGSVGTLAACYRPEDGHPFVYVVDSRGLNHGIGWFVDTLARVAVDAALIVIDGQSNAQTLTERLLAERVPKNELVRPRASDVAAACSSIANAVKERAITHYGQPALDASATGSRRRSLGSGGGWGFQSTDEADATLIEACALAYHAAMTTKRNPQRKAVVW